MKRAVIIIGAIIIVLGAVFAIRNRQPGPIASPDKLPVAASFYPVAFFAGQIGGDKADVLDVTPAGAEPHDYEPSPRDMAAIESSRLIILNGGGLEAWADNLKRNADPSKTVVVVAGEGLTTREVEEDGKTMTDPHVWLSPPLAVKMVDTIEAGFVAADPSNAAYYAGNAAALKQRLTDLDLAYRQGLTGCRRHDIITSHAAFGYLAATYGLNQVAITGLSPDAEPSAQQLADIAQFAKTNDVKYIFFESLVSPKLADTVAHEIGAETLVLNPIEGLTDEELAAGKDYFGEMGSNLDHLEIALRCIR